MNFSLIISAFAIFGSLTAAPRAEEDLADKVQNVVDEILSNLRESINFTNNVIDIPTNDIENGQITLGEISLNGYKAVDTKFTYDDDSSRLNYTFNWEKIDFVFDITLQLEGFITVDNHLIIKVDYKDIVKEGYAIVSEDPKEVLDLSLVEHFGEINFDIQGLLNDDEISENVSKFLTDYVARMIDAFEPAFEPYVSAIIEGIINVALKQWA